MYGSLLFLSFLIYLCYVLCLYFFVKGIYKECSYTPDVFKKEGGVIFSGLILSLIFIIFIIFFPFLELNLLTKQPSVFIRNLFFLRAITIITLGISYINCMESCMESFQKKEGWLFSHKD